MKNIDRLIKQQKQLKQMKESRENHQYTAGQTLAIGISDGSIEWGDNRFVELISGDIMRIIQGGLVNG